MTGGLGYIGSHVMVEILQSYDLYGFKKIVILDKIKNMKVVYNILAISGYVGPQVVFEQCDLREMERL